ncbi:putative nicotinate-nucleotide adenylyltransferase [Bacteroidia bacterium]|nr:putative nicotinate-nucleotide adenylyltransferase [Bacteroidia bacterium]
MKIGIFPGSFNPVHIGHLAIANYIAEYEGFDEIWFLITPKNPLKDKSELIDPHLRLRLLDEVIGAYPKFKTSTIEWDMPQPCYTINTLQKLRMLHPNDSIELIIGADNWLTIHRWKDYQTILKNFKTVIYPRTGSDPLFYNFPNVRMIKDAPKIEISSTFIRKAIRQGKDFRFYMPIGAYETLNENWSFPAEEPAESEKDKEI